MAEGPTEGGRRLNLSPDPEPVTPHRLAAAALPLDLGPGLRHTGA